MTTTPAGNRLPNLWDDAHAASMSESEKLLYRSNLLGSDQDEVIAAACTMLYNDLKNNGPAREEK